MIDVESSSNSDGSGDAEENGPSQDFEMQYQNDLEDGAEGNEVSILPKKRGRKKQADRLLDRTKVRFDPKLVNVERAAQNDTYSENM